MHYKDMRAVAAVVVLVLLVAFVPEKKTGSKVYSIPKQTFDPWLELGFRLHDTITIDSFSITAQVTLGEYKAYLAEMKGDSGEAYYRKLLPDSAMCVPESYIKYMNTPSYEAFPVCGVSWVNAVRYCEWKTAKNNPKDSIRMVYRLPVISEWMAAYRHLTTGKIPNELNRNYSDWMMEAFDESVYDFMAGQTGSFEGHSYVYPDRADDVPVLRRKRIMGNSFHFQHARLADCMSHYAYSYEGYSYISFRMVIASPKAPGSRSWLSMLAQQKKWAKK